MNRISHYFRNQQSKKGRTIYKLNAFVKKNYDKTNFKNCISRFSDNQICPKSTKEQLFKSCFVTTFYICKILSKSQYIIFLLHEVYLLIWFIRKRHSQHQRCRTRQAGVYILTQKREADAITFKIEGNRGVQIWYKMCSLQKHY